MAIKMMHHVCIQTNSYSESLEFYTKILGLTIVQETKDFHNRDYNTWLKLGEFFIELQTGKKEENLNNWSETNEGIVHMCFLVVNVNIKMLKSSNMKMHKYLIVNVELLSSSFLLN